MTSPEPEIDPLIDALRSDLPDSEHERRVRARLIAAGVIATGGIAAPGTAAGASALNAAGGAKAGVLAKAVALLGGSGSAAQAWTGCYGDLDCTRVTVPLDRGLELSAVLTASLE